MCRNGMFLLLSPIMNFLFTFLDISQRSQCFCNTCNLKVSQTLLFCVLTFIVDEERSQLIQHVMRRLNCLLCHCEKGEMLQVQILSMPICCSVYNSHFYRGAVYLSNRCCLWSDLTDSQNVLIVKIRCLQSGISVD